MIETTRLVLREISPADIDVIEPILADAEVMRYWPAPLTRADSEQFVGRTLERYQRNGFDYWLALLRPPPPGAQDPAEESSPEVVVGLAGVLMQPTERSAPGSPRGPGEPVAPGLPGAGEPGLGYIFDRRWWGRGYATEAAAACRDWIFNELGRDRAVALIRPENRPSQRVAQRVGMTPGATVMHAEFEHVVWSVAR